MTLSFFASGNGSNMECIVHYFREHPENGISFGCLITNNSDAFARERAKHLGIPDYALTSKELATPGILLPLLERHDTDAIILAGYLKLVPRFLLEAYPQRIVNIHPALLPKYGGKGMYGHHVHEAVHQAGEDRSGITIHLIDEEYDKGQILFQAEVALTLQDTPKTIAQKVQALEHRHFAPTIAEWARAL